MKFLIDDKPRVHFILVLIHLMLGFVMVYLPMAIVGWYYFVLGYLLYLSLKRWDRGYVLLLIAYDVGIEVIGRMGNLSPYIPWELCKYITPLLFILAIVIEKGNRSKMIPGLLIVLFSVPALLYGEDSFSRLIFAMGGVINMGLMIALFYNRGVSLRFLLALIRVLLLPFIPILIFITLKTPSFSDMEFSLAANFDTTGGFGSNQISTILGIGVLLLSMTILIRKKIFGSFVIDMLFAGYFLFRGLLSFSRGGIVVAFIAFVAFFYVIRFSTILPLYGIKMRKVNLWKILIIITVFIGIFLITDTVTHGALLNRYKGETRGTLSGSKDKSLGTITTGRWGIMVTDIEMWRDNPVWGVGGGQSALMRPMYGHMAIAAHTELSRMLSEQGIFGIVIILFLLLYLPLYIFFSRNSVERAFLYVFLIIGVLTSFHAGMRTFVTPFFVGLSTIRIVPSLLKQRY